MKFFWCQEFFFMNFDYKNWWKNEFKDNNEKSCSWSRNRVSHKIDFKAQWPRNGHADSLGVKKSKYIIYVWHDWKDWLLTSGQTSSLIIRELKINFFKYVIFSNVFLKFYKFWDILIISLRCWRSKLNKDTAAIRDKAGNFVEGISCYVFLASGAVSENWLRQTWYAEMAEPERGFVPSKS